MSPIILAVCGLAIVVALFYAIAKGKDVKTAIKLPLISITFEAKDGRVRKIGK
jgi:hypothetical protein